MHPVLIAGYVALFVAVGAAFLAVGLFLWSGLNHPVEAWLLDTLPPWLTDLSVAL